MNFIEFKNFSAFNDFKCGICVFIHISHRHIKNSSAEIEIYFISNWVRAYMCACVSFCLDERARKTILPKA